MLQDFEKRNVLVLTRKVIERVSEQYPLSYSRLSQVYLQTRVVSSATEESEDELETIFNAISDYEYLIDT